MSRLKILRKKKKQKQVFSLQSWVSIDPGLSGLGFAIWEGKKLKYSNSISINKKIEWWEKVPLIIDELILQLMEKQLQLDLQPYQEIFFELPYTVLHGSIKNEIANKKQDIIKLTILAGALFQLSTEETKVVPVKISDWKGQLTKEQMRPRIMRCVNKQKYKLNSKYDHEEDAVGIGFHLTGEL